MAGRRTLIGGLVAVATTALSPGCSFTGGFGEGYRCGDGDVCPTGTTCVGGFCVAAPADAATPGDDGATPDADLEEARCGTLSLLQDSFTDAVPGVFWDPFSDLGANTVEIGGHLAIQLGAGSGDPYAGYTSRYAYDLTDGALVASVPQVGGQNTILEVRNHDGAKLQMVVEGGDLVAVVFDAPDAGERARIPYVAADHAHWRIREADGTLFWETSPDGAAWNQLWSEPVTFSVDHVLGIASAGGELAIVSEARFDEINPGAPVSRFCPTATLVDTFDGAPFRPLWENWSDGLCTVVELGGNLQMNFTGVGGSFCGIGSRHLLDLRDSEIVLDATEVPQQTMFVSYFQVVRPGDDDTHVEMSREGASLRYELTVDDVDTGAGSTLYSATDHRYWRLRERDGTIYWDASPDGAAWTTIGQTEVAFDVSAVQVIVGAGHYGDGSGEPTVARFGSVNQP